MRKNRDDGVMAKFNERDLKSQIKDYLNTLGYYNWPVTAGMGSHKGQPDRIAHIIDTVVYIEAKLPKGNLSEHQLSFQEQCAADHIEYWVIRSIEELQQHIKELRDTTGCG